MISVLKKINSVAHKKTSFRIVKDTLVWIEDPRDALLDINKSYACMLPLSSGRVGFFYTLDQGSSHPFFIYLKSLVAEGLVANEKAIDLLKKYDELLDIRNANDFYGLSDNRVFGKKSHPFEGVFPWRTAELYDNFNSLKQTVFDENKEWDLLDHSYLGSGDQKKVEVESARLNSLYQSILCRGYDQAPSNLIDVELFLKGRHLKWSVKGGHHRAAAFSALALGESIPAKISRFIRYEDLEHWPNVRNGLYSKEAADEVFHRFFNAEPPQSHKSWVEYCRVN